MAPTSPAHHPGRVTARTSAAGTSVPRDQVKAWQLAAEIRRYCAALRDAVDDAERVQEDTVAAGRAVSSCPAGLIEG
jgi:hypothetical protein